MDLICTSLSGASGFAIAALGLYYGKVKPAQSQATIAQAQVQAAEAQLAVVKTQGKSAEFDRLVKLLEIREKGTDRELNTLREVLRVVSTIPSLDIDITSTTIGSERRVTLQQDEKKRAAIERLPDLLDAIGRLRQREQTARESLVQTDDLSHADLDAMTSEAHRLSQDVFATINEILRRPQILILDKGEEVPPSTRPGALVFRR